MAEQAIATVEAAMSAGGHLGHKKLAQPTEEYIQIHRAILSPLRRFPPELLEEIFRHCQEEHEDLYLNSPPWHLLHICQLWRQVALGMSSLWRHLPPMVHQPKSKRFNLSKIQFLLQHSSNAKITFLVYQTNYLVPGGVLPLLLRHSHQWERVALYVSDYVCEFLSRSTLGRLPSLTTLTIDFQALKRPHALFTDAPKLRTLRCAGFIDHPMIPSPSSTAISGSLPWKLTSFTSHAVLLDTHILLKVLVESQELEKLDVALRALDDPWLQIPPTTLPSLTSLILRFPPGPQVHQSILSNLTLPCLTELFVGLFPPPRLLVDLAGMLTRSMCPLQHLTIQTSIHHLNWNIINTLKLTPQLKSLDMNGLIDQRLTEKLCSWNQEGGWELVPLLESLTIHTERNRFRFIPLDRCDLVGESGMQVRQRLENFFVVTSAPLSILEDLRGIPRPADFEKLLKRLRTSNWSKSDGLAIYSQRVASILSLVSMITDPNEILYLYVRCPFLPISLHISDPCQQYSRTNILLWKFFFSVPSKLRPILNLRRHLEDLFTNWANVVAQSSSHVRWIWDRHGYLKYSRDSAEGMFFEYTSALQCWLTVLNLDRAFVFFRLKRFFFEEEIVDRSFPHNEDHRPVNTFL